MKKRGRITVTPKWGGGSRKGNTERRAIEILKRRPELPDRKIAKASGVSLERVRQLRVELEQARD